jgi:O-antigen/teichoic acid export membrane protein
VYRRVTELSQFLIGKEESATLRARLLGGASGLLTLRIGFSGLSFFGSVLLARLLGDVGFGFYSYAFAWIVLLGVPAMLGMDQLLARDIAAYHAREQWGMLRGLLRKATRAVSLASFGLALAAGGVASFLLRGHGPSPVLHTFWVALLLIPLITLTRVRQSAMQGLHRVAMGAMPEQLIQPGLLLGLLGAAYLLPEYRLTAAGAMGMNVVATAVAFLVGAVLLYRTLPPAVKAAPSVPLDLPLARSALPLLFIGGANVLFGQVDILILGVLKDAAAVGIYTVARKGADFISFPLTVQNSAFASTAASLYAVRDLERLQRLVTRLARLTFLASLPLGIFLMAFGRLLLYVYGPQFGDAQTSLAILSFSQLVNVAFGAVDMLLIVTGFERDAATAVGAGAAANLAFNFLLIPRWGSAGAAVGYSIGMVVWNVWMSVVLYRKTGIVSTVLGKLRWSRHA